MTKLDESAQRYRARREAIRDHLARAGMDPGVAERWCVAWEAEAALRGVGRTDDFWEAGRSWIDGQCAARRQPPN
jgi:hypothetical protein